MNNKQDIGEYEEPNIIEYIDDWGNVKYDLFYEDLLDYQNTLNEEYTIKYLEEKIEFLFYL